MIEECCPHCLSKNIYYSKKLKIYRCEDCEENFDNPNTASGIKVFLSYDHEKSHLIDKIEDYLNSHGYNCWRDKSDIKHGDDWRERITNGIYHSEQVISFVTKRAMRNGGVCVDEIKIAVTLKKPYIQVVRLENIEPPAFISHNHRVEMTDWADIAEEQWDIYFERKMADLLQALQGEEATRYKYQMGFISNNLMVSPNSINEDLLNKKSFFGRKWLFDMVDAWFDEPMQRVLAVYGIPGVGKSAFSAKLSYTNHNVFASLFFKYNDNYLNTAEGFTRQLAFKLAAALPDYRFKLYNILKENEQTDTIKSLDGQQLFEAIILNPLFYYIDGGYESGIIILDGLDEASNDVVDLIVRNLEKFPEIFKFIVTARNENHITCRFKEYEHTVIDQSVEQNLADIKEYIRARIKDIDEVILSEIVQKTEGSFMYAVCLCDSICSGKMSINNLSGMPFGLNNFYREFFNRIFADISFKSVRPLLEILCIEDTVPSETVANCLGIEEYDLSELRSMLKSLILTHETHFSPFNNDHGLEKIAPNLMKTIRFAHQSFKEWLTNPELANNYYVDVRRGYRAMAKYCENAPTPTEPEAQNDDRYSDFLIDVLRIGEDPTIKPYERFHKETIKKNLDDHYVKWLILGEEYEKAENLLIKAANKTRGGFSVPDASELLPHWRWADLFPNGLTVRRLSDKLCEAIEHISGFLMDNIKYEVDSPYNLKLIQITFIVLFHILDSGRFAPAFFKAIQSYPIKYLIENTKYNDGGQYSISECIADCLAKLYKANVEIPVEIREICEEIL